MSKTITANIPASKISWKGQTRTYPARAEVFAQDDAGRWSNSNIGPMSEAEVIDVCRKASNWPAIRQEHFPMFGFHS